ncbi:helix-turn-helix domain-containing protein [Metaclostridioides mangenotii]|uniref:helix-turn-helix domain-containing protein n=1 Tax=Metaclostridioides mangenotii TaxID=1540 RepID=UPI000464546A|nr:helix-turn-helix transcriptional regulator [Clostridioides mangenotii]
MEIAVGLKRILKEKGVTAYKISKDLNINESLIYQILRGEVKNPRVLTLKKIADYLEVSVDELVCDIDAYKKNIRK